MSLLQIFGNTSIYTGATFFLMRTWQGKSLLCNLVLLTAVWTFLQLWEKGKSGERKGKAQAGWWLLLCAVNVTAAMATTMGAFLLALFTAVCGLVLAGAAEAAGISFSPCRGLRSRSGIPGHLRGCRLFVTRRKQR